MNDNPAEPTDPKSPNASGQKTKGTPTMDNSPSGGRQGTQAPQSVEDLMQLRTAIDQELNQRLSQNLCLMLADVVGSTSFYQKHGDVQGRLFVQRHHDILSPLVNKYGGTVIKTIGDAVMASFEEPERALDCSVAAQQELCEASQEGVEDTPLQTRISLHYGSALVEANDIFGDLVNMSARLNDLVEPDQILISEEVYDRVKDHTNLPLLPLEPVRWKEGEKGLAVYEVLWQQKPEVQGDVLVLRDFDGANSTCFYCGLREHQVTSCPSKQLYKYVGRLDRLGYLPLSKILSLFQQEDLSNTSSIDLQDAHISDAFYEICLPYQIRFLIRIWQATSQDWRQVERQQITASPMAGTRLWVGFDCLRVGRLDDAHHLLLVALDSNPDDYKPYVALGFWAMEKADPFAALKYWRKALSLINNNLQGAYLHLLMHRLYDVNGKTGLAQQQLQKALSKDPYLHEARYRRIALLAKKGKGDKVLPQLQKLIQDDRTTYLKVLLDPAFAPRRSQLIPFLSTLLKEARSAAIEQMRHISEELKAFREWYQQPEAELVTVEKTVERMRQHIKSGSYFGYRDVVDDGDVLRERIQKLTARRKSHLHNEFKTVLGPIHRFLSILTSSLQFSQNHQEANRLAKCQKELARLPKVQSLQTANQFWRAWKDLHALKTAVEQLDLSLQQRGFLARKANQGLRYILLFGLGGGVMVDTALFGVIGYLAYFSRLRFPEQQLLLFLILGALGGSILGSGVGWLAHWYRSRQ